MLGLIIYIITRWSVEFQKTQNDKKTWGEWKNWCFTEINEWVIAFVGAIVFYLGGEGSFFGIIELTGADFNKWSNVFVDIEKLYYIFGGALGGTLLLLSFKAIVNKAKKKLED